MEAQEEADMKEEKTDRAGEENEDPDTDGAPSDPVPEEESAENETDEEAGEEKSGRRRPLFQNGLLK